jgi:hypothetical protein
MANKRNSYEVEIDRFRLALIAVVTLTLLCGIALVVLALFGPNPQPAPVARLFETLTYCFTVGMLTTFGLLGLRRAPPPDR